MAFDKLKRFAGIGTLDVTVTGPETVDLETGTLTATVVVRAKSDCEVSSVAFTFVNERQERRDSSNDDDHVSDHEVTTSRTLGRAKLPGFTIANGETREFSTEINFTPKDIGRLDDKLREKGGVLGKIGELGLLSSASGTFEVSATFDVVGAANDPDDSRTVRVV